MQLAPAPPVTTGPTWRFRQPLPTNLPAAASTQPLTTVPWLYGGRIGEHEAFGTDTLQLGVHEDGWLARGSFDEAVAAARDLSRELPTMRGLGTQRGSIAVVEGRAGWLLLRAGTTGHGGDFEHNYDLDRDAARVPVVRPSRLQGLQALVGPTTWIDLRPTAGSDEQ